VAAAIILGFDCYLRHSELRNLRVQDVALPGDPRLQDGEAAHIVLRFTKAGKPQQVKVRDALALAFLSRLVRGRGPREFLFGALRNDLLHLFQGAQVSLGFPTAPFVLHSLRHGGASFDHMHQQPINDTMMRGRWSGLKITKNYIQEAQARTLLMTIPHDVRKSIAIYLASPAILRVWLGL
jgi:integrase